MKIALGSVYVALAILANWLASRYIVTVPPPKPAPPVVRSCPYCGRPLKGTQQACSDHSDLPGKEPL